MKLATLNDGTRDGQLAVVSRDLSRAHIADAVAPTLQRALDDWPFVAPQLQDLFDALERGQAPRPFPFDPARCMAPLPRAFQWIDTPAYPSHLERLRAAPESAPPAPMPLAPPMRQGAGDDFQGATDDAPFGSADAGIDYEAKLAVITGDVPMGASAELARSQVRLLALANDWCLRRLAADEGQAGFGFFGSRPVTAFAPVAVTPDELGEPWREGRVHGTLRVQRDGRTVGELDAGAGMALGFGQLVALAARQRRLRAGTLVGSGPVSSRDAARGFACIAEARALEAAAHGEPRSAWMGYGERVRIELLDARGRTVLGAIEQQVAEAQRGV